MPVIQSPRTIERNNRVLGEDCERSILQTAER